MLLEHMVEQSCNMLDFKENTKIRMNEFWYISWMGWFNFINFDILDIIIMLKKVIKTQTSLKLTKSLKQFAFTQYL